MPKQARQIRLLCLEPCVVIEVKFTQWTTSGMLRNPEFVAIRDDKDPTEVEREA